KFTSLHDRFDRDLLTLDVLFGLDEAQGFFAQHLNVGREQHGANALEGCGRFGRRVSADYAAAAGERQRLEHAGETDRKIVPYRRGLPRLWVRARFKRRRGLLRLISPSLPSGRRGKPRLYSGHA